MEVKNGKLYGRISGREGRIAYGPDDILTIEKEGNFEISLNKIRLADFYQAEDIPDGMQFIASIQGKYYYSVFDKRALAISPKNRLYFPSAEEAEKYGYLKK